MISQTALDDEYSLEVATKQPITSYKGTETEKWEYYPENPGNESQVDRVLQEESNCAESYLDVK